jgi:eukaryotic-like serine/threonine-protein kinase
MALIAGQIFGNYQVVRLVGEGGFGEVYEACNELLQRRAAIKVLHTRMVEEPELVRRFFNEARAASAIRHPNIIEVLDAGVAPGGEPYILMEFLEGDSLQRRLLREGRMPVRMALEIARQTGSALSAAHAAGIIHRDLKPENIFLVTDPDSPIGFRVKVLDFGIAKVRLRGAWGSAVKTQAGLVMGSPAYMSPEQCRDSSEVDHRSDIYSLAVMVYEMLAGTPPFASQSTNAMLVLQLSANPPPLRSLVPDVADYVEQAVMRALSKERDLRYDCVADFVGALRGNYPAPGDQGSAAFPGNASVNPTAAVEYSAANHGNWQEPSSLPVSARGNGRGLRPAESVFVASPAITTLSRATGEAAVLPEASASDADLEGVRRMTWPIFAVVGAVAVGLSLFLVLRPGASPGPIASARPAASENAVRVAPSVAPSAPVSVRVSSSPAGATVVDGKDGSVLGQTPFEKYYPEGKGVLEVVLRLAGYHDKSVAIGLGASSSTSVNLEPNDTVRAEPAKKPAATSPEHSTDEGARRMPPNPPKPMHRKEEEWRVH